MNREQKLLADKARWQQVHDEAEEVWKITHEPLVYKRMLNARKNIRRVNEALLNIGPTVGSVKKELKKAAE